MSILYIGGSMACQKVNVKEPPLELNIPVDDGYGDTNIERYTLWDMSGDHQFYVVSGITDPLGELIRAYEK